MGLSPTQLKFLRGLAHSLKPVVTTGQHGLSDAVMNEVEIALEHHELIKVRLRAEKPTRKEYAETILGKTGAVQVLFVGQVLTIYRPNPKKPKIQFD
ncbi:MAG: YhbY family RNA-binding protein [Gammaproteobacteria bacterium]